MIPDEQLDFEACVRSGQVFRFKPTDSGWEGVDGDNLITATRVKGGWKVSSAPNESAWRRFLQVDRDLVRIRGEIVRIEPRLKPIVEAMPGLRTLRPSDPIETLFSFLCTANNHMSRIVRMVEYLASKGPSMGAAHHRFPSVDRLADLSEAELRKQGFGYRGATIPKVAQRLSELGEDWLQGLRAKGYLAARSELCELPGVGRKLADCVCLFGLHFDEAVPLDTHVWKAATNWYFPQWRRMSLTPSRYEQVSLELRGRFGHLSGWVQQYVFYSQYLEYRRRYTRGV